MKKAQNKFLYNRSYADNRFCFLMMLIYIKIKYGDYNPNILFNICNSYHSYFMDVFNLFIDSLKENGDKKELLKHFFLTKDNLFSIKNYISKNISSIKSMKNSFFFKYLKKYRILGDIKTTNLHFINIPENINLIYNKIIKGIYKEKIFYFDFLKEDYGVIQENNILNRIELLKSISNHTNIGFIKNQDNSEIYVFDKDNWKFRYYEYNKYNTFMNLYKFLKTLKNAEIILFNCLCGNFYMIGQTIWLFLNIYVNILESYKPIKKMKEQINFILNEMVNFFLFFLDI